MPLRRIIIAALMCVPVLGILGTSRAQDVKDREDIRRTFRFSPSAASRKILVDNVNGPISLTGYRGDSVELVVHRTIRAESQSRVKEAKENVNLEITEEPERILLYVNAPWRCKDGSVNYRGYEYYGYEVTYDFELKVPVKTDISLKTINGGDIDVKAIEGSYAVENINGEVEMRSIRGAGKASTVNGSVRVTFSGNPASPCSFTTINGEVDVRFQGGLSADLRLKTLNGEVFTDFNVTGLPPKPVASETGRKKKIYRSGDSFFVRVGSGGPELTFNTLNGNIYIVRNEE